jgi:hypothetical protein
VSPPGNVDPPDPSELASGLSIGRRLPGPALRPERPALRAPQGYAPGQANDEKTRTAKTKGGGTSNEVTKGTFLKSFTVYYYRIV